jgi:hypothetical protein
VLFVGQQPPLLAHRRPQSLVFAGVDPPRRCIGVCLPWTSLVAVSLCLTFFAIAGLIQSPHDEPTSSCPFVYPSFKPRTRACVRGGGCGG